MLHIKTDVVCLELNMKKTINDVIVVEGTNDASYISSFIEALIVVTNGYEIPNEEIDFLNHLPKDRKILILTDSDSAGEEIRKRINKIIANIENIFVDISKCNKNNKHGVAECDKEELLKVLDSFVTNKLDAGELTTSDLLKLGINSKDKRQYIAKELHLGKCNNKTLLKRINYLKIDMKTIEKIVGKYGN